MVYEDWYREWIATWTAIGRARAADRWVCAICDYVEAAAILCGTEESAYFRRELVEHQYRRVAREWLLTTIARTGLRVDYAGYSVASTNIDARPLPWVMGAVQHMRKVLEVGTMQHLATAAEIESVTEQHLSELRQKVDELAAEVAAARRVGLRLASAEACAS